MIETLLVLSIITFKGVSTEQIEFKNYDDCKMFKNEIEQRSSDTEFSNLTDIIYKGECIQVKGIK